MATDDVHHEGCPHLVLLGHIVKEMIYFPDRTLGPVLGSPVAYGSVVAGRLGESVGIVTIIGSDMPPELLRPFEDAGVDTRGLQVRRGNWTTASELIYQASGSKEIRYPQRAPQIGMDDIPAPYLAAQIFYVATMDHDLSPETVRQLADAKRGLLAIDLGGYGGAHSRRHPDEAEQRDPAALRQLVSCCDIVRASVEDCAHLLGAHRVAHPDGERGIVQGFLDWGASISLLTLGERGCLVGTRDGIQAVPAAEGHVVDTTGAGDTFSTAFLVGYLRTSDVAWAARFGAATAMAVIERTGGVRAARMPTWAEVEARMGGLA